MNSTLQTVLNIIQIASGVAAGLGGINPAVGAGGEVALALEQIVQQSLNAYQATTGQPMDLTQLQPITPIE
jgi:hypothetical protein